MPKVNDSPGYGTFSNIVRQQLGQPSPLRVLEKPPLHEAIFQPQPSKRSLANRVVILDDTTSGSSFSESDESVTDTESDLQVAVDVEATEPLANAPLLAPGHYQPQITQENLAAKLLHEARKFKNFSDPEVLQQLNQRHAEIKQIHSRLIKASFLVFTLLFTLPALCYYNKELKKIKNQVEVYQISTHNKFRELENEVKTSRHILPGHKSEIINEIAMELGLNDLFYLKSGTLEWKDKLAKIADDYKKGIKPWNEFTVQEQVAFISHLKRKGVFDKNSAAAMHFVIELFKPKFADEVWELRMSSLIDACLDGRYGPDRAKTEKIVKGKIDAFKEEIRGKDLKDGYAMPLIHQLWKANLFNDHRFFVTCNLLEEELGISRPDIIEVYNSLPSWKSSQP